MTRPLQRPLQRPLHHPLQRLLPGLLAFAVITQLALAEPPPASAAGIGVPVRIAITSGVVVGTESAAVRTFKAIPYAAPPVGELRWKPPEPPPSWNTERDATVEEPACPQPLRADGRTNPGGYAGLTREDCLTLNVTAPARASRAPVMVWIYGGGNVYGADNLPSYDGAAFARDGVVLVKLNYRLGALGFFAHPALTAEAGSEAPLVSYGLMDQIEALRWVKRNIAAFGGDPGNVTVFGESAGGEDVLHLLIIRKARGLFARAIVESGLGWDRSFTLSEREEQGVALASKLGAAGAAATARDLRALPVEKIIEVTSGRWGPAVDGRLIRERITQAFAHGHQAHVPLIIGSNSFEASLVAAYGGDPLQALADVPPALRAVYAEEAQDDQALAYAIFTDQWMGAPARWLAAKASRRAPAFLYYFSYLPVARRGVQVGANHASEIPYVFDSLEKIPGRAALLTDSDRATAALMHACWVSFARTGAPRCTVGGRGWPAYEPGRDELLEFGVESAVRQHLRKRQLDAEEVALRHRIP